MTDKKEMTAPNVSVGADTEQSIQKCTDNSITDYDENIKDLGESFREMQREMLRQMDPSYMKTVSMSELYDTVYQSNPPLIDGLLYPGTYILRERQNSVKDFLWHSLLTISVRVRRCGTSLSVKEQHYTLRLKMITAACRNACIECSERRVRTTCTSLFRQVSLETVLTNSLQGLWRNTPKQN